MSWLWSNPQFEAGREQIGKNGIIKDPKIHLAVLEKVAAFCWDTWLCGNGIAIPIQGGHGQHRIFDVSRKKEEKTKPTTEQLRRLL